MNSKSIDNYNAFVGPSNLSERSHAETITAPPIGYPRSTIKMAFEMRSKPGRRPRPRKTTKRQIYARLLQLKVDLATYIEGDQFVAALNFGYFLNEYIRRQNKYDNHFAIEIGVSEATISQYLNNHRKPTTAFLVRLELHSDKLLPAVLWFKLLQKEMEQELIGDNRLRMEETKHLRKRLNFDLSK
jgi:hypothetical protein